ncbi:hypothetical protein E2C01_039400 [Portunus trituberculatus]|uniref:Uncharacterized protein n=1 Tax=Portunus trituberculatus TaxID=210409 RepID=A0A5B7FMY0_PORTR|nr:hypothetical protein [Portunus trituberculatus]
MHRITRNAAGRRATHVSARQQPPTVRPASAATGETLAVMAGRTKKQSCGSAVSILSLSFTAAAATATGTLAHQLHNRHRRPANSI